MKILLAISVAALTTCTQQHKVHLSTSFSLFINIRVLNTCQKRFR